MSSTLLGPVLAIAAVLFLVLFGGLFAAVDAALVTVSIARVDDLVEQGRPGAKRLRRLLVNRPLFVNLAVLLRTFCEIVATVAVFAGLEPHLPMPATVAVTAAAMIVISYVFIGVGPRTLGRQHAYTLGCATALLMQGVSVLMGPVTRLLILLGNAVTPGRGFRNGPFASEVELRELVDLAQGTGVVDAGERRMIQSVFELGDTAAREVMVPRPEMVWIEADKSVRQAIRLAVRSGHSRMPVIGENADDVVGVVYLKDLVALPESAEVGTITVGSMARQARFVPDSKPVDALLRDMQRTNNHMAVLVNEYGSIAGLVTIEDVLEEIVGEITDEYDAGEIAPVEDIGDGDYRVSARLDLGDLGELFGLEIEEDEVDTVGGLLGLALGRVPLPGAEVTTHGLHLTAEGGTDRRGRMRISTVVVRREAEPGDEDPASVADREATATARQEEESR
ncbi:hemolysin family protein [Tsukamurella sp. 8F]|uniref:hemolysin family protein n=1 Tax=unclassified Tsukamurella TaxID=2633480 RepID=UPI0023B9EFB6|nr:MULTISPECIES: hemolysin family protein [unclassified Tsukamurella]MDF0530015.1 hemolysin family protein [Tsukamurella sp. 8J]MDF0587213.1 hemolysin family protein [Tsukamurella sp. 8F]